MSSFFRFFRETASRVYKRKGDDDGELHPLQEVFNKYSSSCFNLFQACIVGDVDAVRWYISVGKIDVNQTDKNGCTALFYTIQKNHVVLVKDLIKAGADINLMASLEEGIKVTPVHIAAKYDRCECLKILLEHGADANIANSFGQTPLHTAARRKLNRIVEILIKTGKAKVNSADHDMVTALHLAVTPGNENGRQDVVKTLLENGANPFCQDNEGNTVFHEASENGGIEALEILCEYKGYDRKKTYYTIAEVLNKPRKDGYNCLHLAVKSDHEKVIQLCIDYKADLNRKTTNGDSPMHIACSMGHHKAGTILVENGADINSTDRQNYSILHRAAAKGNVSCCALLLEKGANIDAVHHCGTALVSASFHRQHETVKFLLENGATPTIRNLMLDTCLHIAVKNGDVETVKVIVEKCGDQLLELKDKYENTTLHLAARTGNVEVFKILLSCNPDLKAINDRGKYALHIAAEKGKNDCVKLLVQAKKCFVHVTDFMWRTPLHLACISSNDLEVVSFLLENGADPNARDDRRWTPLLYVAARGCPCCTALLVEYGAKINEWDKNRMTALSIAASNNKSLVVESLLKHDADPTILTCDGLNCMDIALNNRFHDVCMVIAKSDKWKEALVSTTTMEKCLEVSPEVAKVILDKCVEYSGREIDKDYKVTYNFELLDPHPDTNEDFYGPLAMKIARRHELLTHPLTKKLLQTNWKNGARYVYYTQMFLIAVAILTLTWFLLTATKLVSDCYRKAWKEVDEVGYESPFFQDDTDFCYKLIQNEYNKDQMFAFQTAFFIYFVGYLFKELNQLRLERFEYFLEITNYLDLLVSIMFLIFIQVPSEKPIPYTRLKFGVIGIFAYYFLLFLWTRGLSRFGIYVTMFLEVLSTLLKVVSAFTLLFACFSITFFIIFTTHSSSEFTPIHNTILKVCAMVLGELDYTGLRQQASNLKTDMNVIAIVVFVIFCLTMSLVVNNLLIGLAVGDIELVRKNAEIKLLSLQVTDITESRSKMVLFRRKCYVKTITEMPNKQNIHAEHRQREYTMRKQHKNNKKKMQLVCA